MLQEAQLGTGKTCKLTIGQAVQDGLVDNETLGYFMARTQLFMELVSLPFTCTCCISGLVCCHVACDSEVVLCVVRPEPVEQREIL